MRIAIVGAGGTGGFFGWLLARAGEDVSFIARGRHLEAMQKNGLTLISPRPEKGRIPVRASSDPSSIGPVDLILVCVKTYDLRAALVPLHPLLGPDTLVLGIQNGVDDSPLVELAGERRVLSGVAQVVARLQAPGEIVHEAMGNIVLGERSGAITPRVQAVAETLRRAGIEATASSLMVGERWKKLVWISAQSGLTSLTRRGMGPLFESSQGRALFRAILEESAAIAEHEGVPDARGLADPLFRLAEKVATSSPAVTSSMCRDLLAGGKLELEAIHGDLLRRAARWGLPSTGLAAIYVGLLPYAQGTPAV